MRRAWLGFEVEAVEADDWGRTRGVAVARVSSGSPAAEAGIQAGDRLVGANGQRLATPLDFEAAMLGLRPGDEVEIQVRDRASALSMRAEHVPSLQAERVRVFEDLELVSVTPAIQQEQGIVNPDGALIVSISPALEEQLDLRAGDVLLQINNTRVLDADGAAEALRSLRRQVRIYFERNGGLNVRDFVVR